MRLHSISLSWFRGASSSTSLELGGNSAVIFGENGAGKSSFVDAVEATITGGKVGHLSHSYSGRYQEKGLINTARPPQVPTTVDIKLVNGSVASMNWVKKAPTRTVDQESSILGWDLRQVVLRQEELSDFIRSTKGEKYSTVLPLLGLSDLEIAASNLHKLARSVVEESKLNTLKANCDTARQEMKNTFGEMTKAQLEEEFHALCMRYCPERRAEEDRAAINAVLAEINAKVASSDADTQAAAIIREISTSVVLQRIQLTIPHATSIVSFAESQLTERLKILDGAIQYSRTVPNTLNEFVCPACGREIESGLFKQHVTTELEKLTAAKEALDRFDAMGSEVCDAVFQLKSAISKPILADWKSTIGGDANAAIEFLTSININELRKTFSTTKNQDLGERLRPLIEAAVATSNVQSPSVTGLVDDKRRAETFLALIEAKEKIASIKRAEALIRLLELLQTGVRERITEKAQETFSAISLDVRRYWQKLQPKEAVTEIRLDVPNEADKAIEIYLKFFGKDQDSPMLTLSEGQRNALALSIFLAMANRSKDSDTPLILDDVVISFDRNHRSRVAELLESEFSDRQIVLLTHDREWYYELQRCLNRKKWKFANLRPYDAPISRIQFKSFSLEFDEARGRADGDPQAGMSDCRRIMDVALSDIAERLELKLKYLKGGENDHRTAGQFLVALEQRIKKSYKVKKDDNYENFYSAHSIVLNAKPNLAIWANRSTHTFSGSSQEASDLIDSCEKVLQLFYCDKCQKPIYHLKEETKFLRCDCGSIGWELK